MRLIVLSLLAFTLTGCETIKIATTSKIQPAAPDTDVGIIQIVDSSTTTPLWGNVPVEIKNECQKQGVVATSAAIWAPIVAKLVIDTVSSSASAYVREVKAQSTNSLSFKGVVGSKELRNGRCLVAYRGPTVDMIDQTVTTVGRPNAVVVMAIQHFGNDTFRLLPIYGAAENSISLTKCTGNCSGKNPAEGEINIAVAVSASAAISTALKDIQIRDLGTATLTVKKIPLRSHRSEVKGLGVPSAILTLPADGVAVQLSVGMTEIGDVVGDPDIALGEIQAAIAALSEGALAEIKAHYEKEND